MEQFFTTKIVEWSKENERHMPWHRERNPYRIWLSEIILQQTRVEQGWPYYLKFIEQYPTISDLARAPLDEVLLLWQGLGYYSRARNLHTAAKMVLEKHGGIFPNDYESILALKGVGTYTAAAIASFAYGEPKAVVDGNVYRVLARFFGIDLPIDSTKGKQYFQQLADTLLYIDDPGLYNQALMNFGALVCKPSKPLCEDCPLSGHCKAYQLDMVEQLPVKGKKIIKRSRYFHYLLLTSQEKVYIRKRTEKDIWQHLYEFPLLEQPQMLDGKEVLQSLQAQLGFQALGNLEFKGKLKQQLTHQTIHAAFWSLEVAPDWDWQAQQLTITKAENLGNFAFPGIIDCYLKEKRLYLNL
ncbi:MAG: A/G-specific adenine glycosylase [Chitinophagales bacterium]|nr:A/G-specific adenine glycosylase [Chitinophagales bacterium]